MKIKNNLIKKYKKNKKGYFVLIDPEKKNVDYDKIIYLSNKNKIDALLIGGSKDKISGFDKFIKFIKKSSKIPVILFPGSHSQISNFADAILSLSLINSKSYRYIIGEQLEVSDILYKSNLEIINTSYIVFARKKHISVVKETKIDLYENYSINNIKKLFYLSQNMNFDTVYLESGSGAQKTIDMKIIRLARKIINKPIIVGGGIKDTKSIKNIFSNGADFIVTGNIIEKQPELINEFAEFIKEYNENI